jgi:exodeoxyribonuclease I
VGYRAAMSELSFFWHDYETFGRVPRRDRPAQFAGIRTDEGLQEIGEPVMAYCQPTPDYLPDPESCLLTGILPQHCLARGVPEPRFAALVEAELARAGTVGVGYNTIRFDDEVTRHLFWRNLIDPYAREYKNDCGRWDLLDTVRCMYALRPEGLEWPRHEDGRPSFKLEHLTRANGLAHEAAHDALSDVRATVALARRVREANPRLWAFCLRLRQKQAVWAEIESAQAQGKPFLHVSGMFGPERGCIAVVWPLAPHPTNRNELIVWDLSEDPAELFDLNAAQIRERMFTRADELPEGTRRLPVKSIHVNKSPVVIGNLRTLTPAMAERWGIDLALAERHAQACAARGPSMAGIWPDVFTRPAVAQAPDVDEDLYGGFIGPTDRQRLDRLRAAAPDDPAWGRASFDDRRLDELVFRYRARHAPATLDAGERARWQAHCAARLHEGAGGALTLGQFFERLDTLAESVDERGQALLGELYDYAEQIAPPRG